MEQMVGGQSPAPLWRILYVDKTYEEADLLSEGLAPFIPCQTDGAPCALTKQCTKDNIKVVFTQNDGLLGVTFGYAKYEAWNSIRATFKPTQAGLKAKFPISVKAEIYFEKSNHKTKPVQVIFTLLDSKTPVPDAPVISSSTAASSSSISSSASVSKSSTAASSSSTVSKSSTAAPETSNSNSSAGTVTQAPSSEKLTEGYNLFDDVQKYVDQLIAGKSPAPLKRLLRVNKEYGWADFISDDSIASLPCQIDAFTCNVTKKCTYSDIKVTFLENAEYLDVTFDHANNRTRVNIKPTEAAKQAKLPVTVKGYFTFGKMSAGLMHQTEGIWFEFTLDNKASLDATQIVLIITGVVVLALLIAGSIILLRRRKKKMS